MWKASQGSGGPVGEPGGQVSGPGGLVRNEKQRNEETEAQNCRGTILCICILTIYAHVYK